MVRIDGGVSERRPEGQTEVFRRQQITAVEFRFCYGAGNSGRVFAFFRRFAGNFRSRFAGGHFPDETRIKKLRVVWGFAQKDGYSIPNDAACTDAGPTKPAGFSNRRRIPDCFREFPRQPWLTPSGKRFNHPIQTSVLIDRFFVKGSPTHERDESVAGNGRIPASPSQ